MYVIVFVTGLYSAVRLKLVTLFFFIYIIVVVVVTVAVAMTSLYNTSLSAAAAPTTCLQNPEIRACCTHPSVSTLVTS